MASLCDFIHIYEQNISEEVCEFLISFFESFSHTNTLNLTDHREASSEISDIHNELVKMVIHIRDEYYQFCDDRVFPEANAFEKFMITKINPEEEYEGAYVDIKSYDDARRFLCFKWYLNDNTAGQSRFLDLNIQPEAGKLIVYPPFWLFPHKEEQPIETSKYLLTTYLHYK